MIRILSFVFLFCITNPCIFNLYALTGATPKDIPETIVMWDPGRKPKAGTLSLNFENQYLKGVVFAELASYRNGTGWQASPLEALKAQAVAARTYFLGEARRVHRDFNYHTEYGGNTVDVCGTTRCQAWKEYDTDAQSSQPEVGLAVDETKSEILLYYNSKITKEVEAVQADYAHACSGTTRTYLDGPYPAIGLSPYLQSVSCKHYVPHGSGEGEYLEPEDAHAGGLRGLCQQGAVAFALGTNKISPGNKWNYKQILYYYYSLPILILPKESNPINVGSKDNPQKTEIKVLVPNTYFENKKENFEIKIGGKKATILTILAKPSIEYPNSHKEVIIGITPPTQDENKLYDLYLSIINPLKKTVKLEWIESNAIRYGQEAKNVDAVLVIDRSGSMWGEKMESAKSAAKLFVDFMETKS